MTQERKPIATCMQYATQCIFGSVEQTNDEIINHCIVIATSEGMHPGRVRSKMERPSAAGILLLMVNRRLVGGAVA